MLPQRKEQENELEQGEWRMVLRLDEPVSWSTRFTPLVPFSAWVILPNSVLDEEGGLRESELPTIAVLLEQQQKRDTVMRCDMGLLGERLGEEATAEGAFLRRFHCALARNQVRDPSGIVEGVTVQIEGVLDLSAIQPKRDEEAIILRLSLAGTRGNATAVSNTSIFSLGSAEKRSKPLGGLLQPLAHRLESNALLVEGWALQQNSSLESVSIELNGIPVGEAITALYSPKEGGLLPDFTEAEHCRFSAVINRSAALEAGLLKTQLVSAVELSAHCHFSSGETLSCTTVPILWRDEDPAFLRGRMEEIRLLDDGRLELRGYVHTRSMKRPALSVSWFRAELEIDSERSPEILEWSEIEDLAETNPAFASPGSGRFCLRLPLAIFGNAIGRLRVSALDVSSGERIELGPKSFGQAAADAVLELKNEVGILSTGIQRLCGSLVKLPRLGEILRTESQVKRIVFVSHNLSNVEGAPIVLRQVITALRSGRPELDILVVSPFEGPLRAEFEGMGVQVEVIEELSVVHQSWERYERGLARACELFEQFEPSAVYANVIDSFWSIDLANRMKIPSVWAIHESVAPQASYLHLDARLRAAFLRSLRSADTNVFVSRKTMELFEAYTSGRRLSVIPNGVDAQLCQKRRVGTSKEDLRAEYGLESQTVISIVGTTTERKGQDVFIREMAALREQMPERSFAFFVVGAREGEYLDGLKALSDELDLSGDLRFIPETPEAWKFFCLSDIMVVASREESAPLVSLEAFAYGVPLVSTQVFGLAEQIRDGENALSFCSEQSGQLAERCMRLLQDSALRERLRTGAAASLEEEFSLDRAMQTHLQHIAEALDVGSPDVYSD